MHKTIRIPNVKRKKERKGNMREYDIGVDIDKRDCSCFNVLMFVPISE